MTAIIISETEIEGERHLKFQRTSDTIIQSGHQFRSTRKGIRKKISKFYYDQPAFCRNTGVKSTTGTPISCGDAGNVSAVPRKIPARKRSIVCKQGGIDLFFGKYLSQSLIPAGYLCSAAAALPAYLLTGIFHCIVLWAQGHPAWGAAMSVTLRELCASLLWSLPMTWLFRRVYLRVHVDD